MAISLKPVFSWSRCSPSAVARILAMKRSRTACGSSSSTSDPALKSIQLDLNFASWVLVEIFIVGTNDPNGVPRPVVNNTSWHPDKARAEAATRSLPGACRRLRPLPAEGLGVFQHVDDLLGAALLDTTQRFLLQRGDAALLVAGRRIFVDGLVVLTEIPLEIVDQADGLLEDGTVLGAVHQDGLGAEHLGHFGEHGGAALCDEPVGKEAHERIGRDARKTVGAAALQPDAEVGQRQRPALVGAGLLDQLAADFESGSDLVLDLLSDEELHALVVPLADGLLEGRNLVVLAPETQDEYGTGIGMLHKSGKGAAGVGMVVAQLRTAIVVGIDPHVVEVRAVALGLDPLGDGLGLAVDAPDRRHDPQLVADAHRVVLAEVTHDLDVALRIVDVVDLGRIGILQVVAEVGFEVVGMDPGTGDHGLGGVADGITVLDDILALGDVAQSELVTAGDGLAQGDAHAVDVERFAGLQIVGEGHGDVVRGIDFQKPFHGSILEKRGGSALL